MVALKVIMMVTTMAMLIDAVFCANHTVGDLTGSWDITTSLQAWASSRTFNPGDVLIFKYTALHDVVEVTKADYDSCQITSPINSYTEGNTAIPLNTIGKRYFICGVPGHCNLGMKIEIETVVPGDQAHPFAMPPASMPELMPPMSAMAMGNPSTSTRGSGLSSSFTAPPGASSNSPAKFNSQLGFSIMVTLILPLYISFMG